MPKPVSAYGKPLTEAQLFRAYRAPGVNELRCAKCCRARHVLDLVAHVIDHDDETRCRNPRHLRCRGGCQSSIR